MSNFRGHLGGGARTNIFRVESVSGLEDEPKMCKNEDCEQPAGLNSNRVDLNCILHRHQYSSAGSQSGLMFGSLSYKYFEEGPFKGKLGSWRCFPDCTVRVLTLLYIVRRRM
jgi:hypothetical protein